MKIGETFYSYLDLCVDKCLHKSEPERRTQFQSKVITKNCQSTYINCIISRFKWKTKFKRKKYSLLRRMKKRVHFTMDNGEKSIAYHEGWRKEYSIPLRMEKNVQFTSKEGEKSTVYLKDAEKSKIYYEGWRKRYNIPLRMEK